LGLTGNAAEWAVKKQRQHCQFHSVQWGCPSVAEYLSCVHKNSCPKWLFLKSCGKMSSSAYFSLFMPPNPDPILFLL
jgi:hypothetical protein